MMRPNKISSLTRLFVENILINSQTKSIKTLNSFVFQYNRAFSTSVHCRMRYVQFRAKNGGPQHLGAQLSAEGDIIDISAVDSSIPNSLVKFLKAGDNVIEKAKRIVAEGKSVVSLADVKLLSPITKPDKVVCVGLNYTGHCDEVSRPYPTEPMIFSKFSSCIIGPYDPVILAPISNSIDWETELVIVIGKEAKCIRQDLANEYIFGYTLAQDISAREWQLKRNNGQYLLGKSMDTFCPLGPAVVTKDSLDPNNLQIGCKVNGVVKQKGNTSELIFKIDFIVAYLSQFFTLMPGDIILTGTPAGVGNAMNPPQYLKPGDILESELEGIGIMKNPMIAA